jgi:hypothetical protein
MSVHFYHDDCGVVGGPNDDEPTREELADEAQPRLMASAEALTALCDRWPGDNGSDADLIDALGAEIDALAARIRTALGEPRVLRHGVLVPVGGAAR